MNSADESSWRPDYMMTEQNKRYHKSTEKSHESSLKQSQLMSRYVSLSLISKLILWQISNLMSILINKLVTVILRVDRQYSYNIRETDSEAESLIQVLSLQATTWSKIRLTVDNLVSYSKTSSLSQKTVSLDIFISKKNLSILSLIKNIQEFDLQCRWISS